jgi:hypothetical protein
MKHSVTKFTSLKVALKELKPFIKDGTHLQSGRPFTLFGGMRSREALANWLICAVLNFEYKAEKYFFTSDPTGADGIVVNSETGATWLTEHVMVPQLRNSRERNKDIVTRVVEAVNSKRDKGGLAYASGKQLVVFLDDCRGEWRPNEVSKQLPQPLYFEDVWVAGLQIADAGEYCYGITQLVSAYENAPTWTLNINRGFEAWSIHRIQ